MKHLKHNIKWWFIKHNFFKTTFIEEPFIYIKNGKPSKDITGIIKWLEPIGLYCYYKEKDKLAFERLEGLYPQYKGFIYLF